MAKHTRTWLLFLVLGLALAGCYRSASTGDAPAPGLAPAGETIATPTALPASGDASVDADVTDENGAPLPQVTLGGLPTVESAFVTTTLDPLLPQVTQVRPTAVATEASSEVSSDLPTLLPTATIIIFTPAVAVQQDLAQPTVRPTASPLVPGPVNPALPATPTDLAPLTSDCVYIVQSGDTLFRIALNNDVSLEALVAANDIAGELIQPGQELVIPGCEADGVAAPGATLATTAISNPIAIATPIGSGLPGTGTVHIVRSGEVLVNIAAIYGVSVDAIMQANGMTNPNRLDVGQELVIPAP
jgi:LysM repeat protein